MTKEEMRQDWLQQLLVIRDKVIQLCDEKNLLFPYRWENLNYNIACLQKDINDWLAIMYSCEEFDICCDFIEAYK